MTNKTGTKILKNGCGTCIDILRWISCVSVHHRLFISMPRRGSLATISNLHKSFIPCVSFTALCSGGGQHRALSWRLWTFCQRWNVFSRLEYVCVCGRYHSRIFVRVGHETANGSGGNHDFIAMGANTNRLSISNPNSPLPLIRLLTALKVIKNHSLDRPHCLIT